MYSILVDGELFFDSRVEELALISPVVTLQVNSAGSFTFTIPPNHPFYNVIEKRKSLIEVYRDEEAEPIFAGVATEIQDDFFKQRKVICEGELSFLNDSMQRPKRYYMDNTRLILDEFIKNHNAVTDEHKHFKLGMVTADDLPLAYTYTNYESTMQTIKKVLVEQVGGYLRIRHQNGERYLDYLKEAPNTNTQTIKLGENLIDFKSTLDTTNIATIVIPLGAPVEEPRWENFNDRLTITSVNGGKDYVKSDVAVSNFGWIEQVVEWNEVTDADELKEKGEKYLADTQFENMVIEANAIDLHLDEASVESFKILDQIRVVSAPHGLNRCFLMTKQTINLNNPERDTIVLGSEAKVSMSAKTIEANDKLLKDIENIEPSQWLKQAEENATELITNAQNGYVTMITDENGHPKELLIMDTNSKDTARKVWRWNVNGLGYSSNGYNGSYGLAMTMDGAIVADKITTGIMSADRIRGGELLVGGSGYAKDGSIIVQNASNSQIAKIDKTGVTINKGSVNLIQDSDNYITLDIDKGLITCGEKYVSKYGYVNEWFILDDGGIWGGYGNNPSTSNAKYKISCGSKAYGGTIPLYINSENDLILNAGEGARMYASDDITIEADGILELRGELHVNDEEGWTGSANTSDSNMVMRFKNGILVDYY